MRDFDTYIERCVVKILASNGKVSGTGFWVLDGYCITCTHLIRDNRGNVPPFVSVEYDGKRLSAHCRLDLSNAKEDVAVLQVNGEPVQYVAPLGKATLDTEVRAYGYRKDFPGEGYRVTGILRPGQKLHQKGQVYNFGTSQPDSSSIGGMSGCPVYDPTRRVVVGIQYGEEKAGPGVCYVHPIEKAYKYWPNLKADNTKRLSIEPPFTLSLKISPPTDAVRFGVDVPVGLGASQYFPELVQLHEAETDLTISFETKLSPISRVVVVSSQPRGHRRILYEQSYPVLPPQTVTFTPLGPFYAGQKLEMYVLLWGNNVDEDVLVLKVKTSTTDWVRIQKALRGDS